MYIQRTQSTSLFPLSLLRHTNIILLRIRDPISILVHSGSIHCGLLTAFGFGTNPFLTCLCSLKRKTSSFFVHALARGQDGGVPSVYALSSLYSTPCAFKLTYSSPAPTMMWSRSWIPTMRPTSTSRSVTSMSSRDGCGSPLGC